MKFQGSLLTPVSSSYQNLGKNVSVYFTDSQIVFPKDFPFTFRNSSIKDFANYELLPIKKDVLRINRYRVRFSDGQEIILGVNKENERKLKWVHQMYEVQKDWVKSTALIVAIIVAILNLVNLIR